MLLRYCRPDTRKKFIWWLVFFFPGTCKDLILGLGLIVDHTQCSLCTPLQLTTTLNFHNLDLLIGLRYLLNTNLDLTHNIYSGLGWHHQPPQESVMVILKQWGHILILITLVHTPHLPYICILLRILVSLLECLSSTLMSMFISLFRRYSDFTILLHNVSKIKPPFFSSSWFMFFSHFLSKPLPF